MARRDGSTTQADRVAPQSERPTPPFATLPSLTSPKGGGALRGIDEKFTANAATGTGTTTIAIATSPGRSGVGPRLALTYDSGAGNGPFGFGWTLSVPRITRGVSRRLPCYGGDDEAASDPDTFVLSDAEDLVRELLADGSRHLDTASAPGFAVRRYRPRVEGLFARIERWTDRVTGETHWRTTSRENVVSLYGRTPESRIADPADPSRVFSWLLCETYDDRGNGVAYSYAAENATGVDGAAANERNRERGANRYLERIRYGNRVSFLGADGSRPRFSTPAQLDGAGWMFEVVFDYDDGHWERIPPAPGRPVAEQHALVLAAAGPRRPWNAPERPWGVRPDPFSTYRPGFEVRTYRRCRRALVFHRFDELGPEPYLVRATHFDYCDLGPAAPPTVDAELAHQGSTRYGSFLCAVTQSGYVRDATRAPVVRDGVPYATYLERSLPPLDLEYSRPALHEEVRDVEPEALENLPAGVDGVAYRWVDLDGEGIAGVLAEHAGAWYFKRSLGGGRLGPLQPVATIPAPGAAGRRQLLDLSGDGQLDMVALDGPAPGFHERTLDASWEPHRAFRSLPNVDWDNPNLRMVDLDGDGRTDALITEQDAFAWHPSLGEDGFGDGRRVRQPLDEERGPRLLFDDGTGSVYLADMSGDGLTDLVRIRDGEVCYWPNLGHGRFGAKVTMDDSPRFDAAGEFDRRRLLLADIDGSGVTDLIYLGRAGVRLWFNRAGNGWSAPRPLARFPDVDSLADVTTADLLGNGTACLVWSSPAPAAARRPLRYVDLMGGVKPHLLVRTVNNLGAETRVEFASSTAFYLADRAAGRPWVTRLPFPVHVVRRVTTLDHVSGNRFVTRYAYHHGHFDGTEREFRGFGMVEQWDTEELSALAAAVALDGDPPPANLDAASYSPPAYTRTWFHTGVYLGGDRVSRAYAGLLDGHDVGEYWREPAWRDDEVEAARRLLEDTILPPGLDIDEEREACRALRGMVLRTETFALDGTARAEHPFLVLEQNFTVSMVQRRGPNRHAVFFTHPREALSYHYERNPADPRIAHSLTLDVDLYGNVRRAASIAYGRLQVDPTIADPGDRAEQARMHATCVVSRYTNAVSLADAWRTPMACETRTFELTGLTAAAGALRLSFAEADAAVSSAAEIAFEALPFPGLVQKRLLGHIRSRWRPDDLGAAAGGPLALLPLGTLESLVLPGESWTLALTPGLISRAFGGRVDDAMLTSDGRYVHAEGDPGWWVPTGRVFYSPGSTDSAAAELAHGRAHFFLPCRVRDPFHSAAASTEAFVRYDAHDLLVEETEDALGNRVTAGERRPDPTQPLLSRGNDYRVLRPRMMMDANRNRTAAAFDALGVTVATAVMGKPEDVPQQGDRLDASFRPDLTPAELDAFHADPLGRAGALLGAATTRAVTDVTWYWREPVPAKREPAWGASLAREMHASEPSSPGGVRIQVALTYADGFGYEVQRKAPAEAGPVPARDRAGRIVLGADGRPVLAVGDADPRWVATGWTVLDNKGRMIRRFEPFFTDTHRFERDVRAGVSSTLFRDPIGRVVGTLHADHTWEKTVVASWRQDIWDVGDTVLIADPATDPDVGGYFARLPASEYLPTWHARRAGGAMGARELTVATKSAMYAGTPSIALFDALGRPFATIAHNRVRDPEALPGTPPAEERPRTRHDLDVVGNLRSMTDQLGRVVARSEHDLLGRRLRHGTMEGGERWMLLDVAGAPIHAWDGRGHHLRTTYDRLRRPRESILRVDGGAPMIVGRTDYGEGEPNPEALDLRGRVARAFDQAGVVANERFDFRGNLIATRRRVASDYRAMIDWAGPVTLLAESYVARTRYDALGRPTQVVVPHADLPGTPVSVTQPAFNAAGLLETLDVWLDLGAEPAGPLAPATATMRAVAAAEYDAQGRRTRVETGAGGTVIDYEFDRVSLHLTRIHARRPAAPFPDDCPPPAAAWPGCDVQDLRFTYDPIGNVGHVRDDAQQTIWFRNRRVEASADYTFDALSRLVEATGREHLGQTGAPTAHAHDDVPRARLAHRGDGLAMGRYVERYAYDAAGNLLTLTHRATDPAHPGWRRTFVHDEPSALEPSRRSNRLTRAVLNVAGTIIEQYSVGGDGYDAHGNMRRLPQLQELAWDHADRLRMTRRQAVGPGDAEGTARQGERTWYVYDGAGNRVRKVTESAPGQVREERLYLGGVEIFRRHGAAALVRETLHVLDDERRVALVESRRAGSEPSVPARLVRYQLDGYLGSVGAELDEQGRVVSYEEYSPYGSTTYQAARSAVEAPKRYRYTGKERDEESGFYYHGARYYAPWLARWTSCDPAGAERGPNLYQYVRANPVSTHDPDGAEPTPTPAQIQRWMATHPDRVAALSHSMTDPKVVTATVYEESARWLRATELPDDPRCRPIPEMTRIPPPSGPSAAPTPEGTVTLAELDRRNAVGVRNVDAIVKNPLGAPLSVGAFITGDQDHVASVLNAAQGPSGMVVGMAGVKGGMDRFEAANAEAGIQHRARSSDVAGAGGASTRPKPDGKPASAHVAGTPAAPPPAGSPATAAPMQPPEPFAPLGPAVGGPASKGVPWVDVGSVKPGSPTWTAKGGAKAWTEHGKRIAQLPDDRHQGVAFYDGEGNVFLMIKKTGGMQETVWAGVIGKVKTTGLPGKFGDSSFGTAIEGRVNEKISEVTGQAHYTKDGATTGADYVPRVHRGSAVND